MTDPYRTFYEHEIRRQARKRKLAETHRRQARRRNLIIASFVAFLLVAMLATYSRPDHYAYTAYTYHRVQAGETLWNIVQPHMTARQDIRQVIWLVQQANDMSNAQIFPHDLIRIPVFDSLLAE